MRLLRGFGFFLLGVVALIAIVFLGARFHDGPIGLFPGGALQAGPFEEEPVADWSFATDEETIELQLLSQERSRTTWIVVRNAAAFIPCSLGFPPGKTWHRKAVQDGRAVLRIGGQRYPVSLERIEDSELEKALTERVRAKYRAVPSSDSGVWFFRITSRTP